MDSRKKYAEIASKKKLPKLEELERVFAFKLSKDAEDFYFDIIKGIEESLIYARHVMENLLFLSESSTQSQAYEAKFRDQKLFDSYLKLMELKWRYRKVYFDTTEENCQDFINECYKTWTGDVNSVLLEVCNTMGEAWKNYRNKRQEKQNYFG